MLEAYINIQTVQIEAEKEIAKDELKEFIKSFDSDLSGDNGLLYVSEEALEKGFRNDIDYLINKHGNKSVYYMVEGVMSDVLRSYKDQNLLASCKVESSRDGMKINVTFCYV